MSSLNMPPGFRLVVDSDSPGLNLPPGFRLDTPLARARSYFQRIGTLSDRVHQLRGDRSAADAYVHRFWQERGEALRASRIDLRDMPNEVAVQQLLKETPANVRESVRNQRYKEWGEVAEQQAFREYFQKRETLANAMWQRYREQNPEASDRDSYAAVHNMLATYGFQPPGAGKLPPLVLKENRLETDYTVGWTELKNIVRGIPRGTRRLMVAPKRLGTAAGEFFADIDLQDEPGAEVSTSNIYRQTRKSMDLRREQVNKLFKRVGLEGEEVPYLPKDFDLWGTVGEQIPQLAITAAGAQAARLGHTLSGNTAMVANMFALEGSEAYDSYLRYAAEKGIDPRLASDEAFLGAIAYAAISSALERIGPFELLRRRSPAAFKRLTMAAIGSFVEGGTEFSQAMTQEAIAHGLDLRDFDMESLKKATQEALAGAIGGAGIMSIAYQGPVKPRFIEPGFVDLDAEPPQVYQPSKSIDPIDTVLQFPTDRPAVLEMPPAEVIPFPTELQEFMPLAEGEPVVIPMPPTEGEGEAQVVPFRPEPPIPPAKARVYPEPAPVVPFRAEGAVTEVPVEVPVEKPEQNLLYWQGMAAELGVGARGDINEVRPRVMAEVKRRGTTLEKIEAEAEARKTRILERAGEAVPVKQMSVDEVIGYISTMEENAEVVRPLLGEGPYVQVDVPVQDVVATIRTPGDINAEKLAEAKRRLEAGETPPPVVAGQVGDELVIVDGAHRVQAAADAEQAMISAIIPVAYAEAKGLMPGVAPAIEVSTPAIAPASVEILPEQDSLESPEATPMPGDGGTPLTVNLIDEIRRLASDEEGFWDPEVTGRAIAGGITTISEEAGTVLTGISALTDETAILRRTGPGTLIVEIIDSAISQARLRIGKHLTAFHRAWKALSRASRQWLVTVRDDGQTNHATLIEHPDRITEDIPEGVQAVIDAETAMKEDLGNAAVQAKIPQRKGDGSIGPFQKAEAGRYFRIFTPAGQDALRFQKGPMWDALVQWLTDYSERNPGLPADEISLKEKLRGERKSGETRKQGSLEYTRTFDELPVALKVNGKWQMFQEGRPQNHFRSALESQARRAAFWAEAQRRLLPLFGKYNEETGQMEAPHPSNPKLVDVDGLVDSLRHRAAQAAKRPRAARRAYDRILENYFREHRGGLMEEITLIVGESRLAGVAGVVDRNLMASILSFSGLWDIFQPTAGAHIVGFKRLTKAYARTIADILLHPREYATEYQALGAVLDSFNDWSLRSDRMFLDLLGKNAPQAQMLLAENMERMAQTITARAFDYWSDSINGNLKDDTARMLKKHLRLTDEEVLQVARGEMIQETKAKIIQNGVKTTNYLAEDPHRRGLLRNTPMLRWLIPFTSVMNGSFRAAGRVITDVTSDIQRVVQNKDAESFRNLMRSSGRLITFATLVFGRGFVQQYLRRLLTGRSLIDPEDPEEWWAIALEAFGEGAMFGPYYRILESAKYSGGDPERYVVNLVPRIAILLELATAIGGVGKYEGSPWADRLERAGLRFSPTGRTFRNWYDRFVWPERGEYKKLRSLVRAFNKKRGVKTRYGVGARNPYYYRIFEAIRDNNEVAAREAVAEYKPWAREQGWDSERARTGLRSSLQSRRPINLKEENAKEFLESLSPGDQILAKRVQKRYARLVNELTSREVIRRRAPGAPKAPRPATTIGVDWYGTER